MEIDHLADVHSVNVVAAEDCDEIRAEVLDQVRVLENRVRSSHIPRLVLGLHLRRDGDDETALHVSAGDVPAVDDVFHQALRLELRKNENTVDSAVDEITEYKVDDPVFPAERNRGFGSLVSERCKPSSFSSG